MVLDLKLNRSGNVPWGFRLSGGADFEIPLSVTKVTENSIAEECGLKAGDVIVCINDVSIVNLSHQMVHELIMGFSNTFSVSVIREEEENHQQPQRQQQQSNAYGEADNNNIASNDFNLNIGQNGNATAIERTGSEIFSEISETTVNSNIDSISGELEPPKITEQHIAEMISGESEVLKEHNVIGINFQRIIPKAGLFKSSEVFKQLNEEAMKTKADMDKEVKRWTTFLQKPNRPIPISKAERAKPYQEPYRVRIVKQPKPLCDPNRIATPPPPQPSSQQTAADQKVTNSVEIELDSMDYTKMSATVEVIEDVDDTELPDLEKCNENDEIDIKSEGDQCKITDAGDNIEKFESNEELANVNQDDVDDATVTSVEDQTNTQETKSPEDSALEKQLADVQKQLAALSSLPSTIQATLEAVTKQIAEIMPAFKIRTSLSITGNMPDDSAMKLTEEFDAERETVSEEEHISNANNYGENASTDITNNETTFKESSKMTLELSTNVTDSTPTSTKISVEANNDEQKGSSNEELAESAEEQVVKMKTEKVFKDQEDKWVREREKAQKQPLSIEENQRLIAQSIARNSKLARPNNGPRTPQERPLVLPGGRKWRNAKDAYNEEFIAEIISSQAELITGSTLGKYESPLLGYDDRINFLKYKKPEKDLSNLNRSEVFKLIHSTDSRPANGIAERPAKVMAAEDLSHVSCP